jgi:hypothetical protein
MTPGVQIDSLVIHQELSIPSCIWHEEFFYINQFGQLAEALISGEY